jgi:hypothetical protein
MDEYTLMQRFCSIGADCEFGLAQAKFACHPNDLLKNTLSPVSSLIELLNNDIYALADPAHIRIEVETVEGHFMAYNERFKMRWHGWAKPDGSDQARMVEVEARRVRRLADKLIEDIASGERIFVRKAAPGESLEDAHALHSALSRHGTNPSLLWVDQDTGSLEFRSPILHGHITTSAEVPNSSNAPAADWLALCRASVAMVNLAGLASTSRG